MHVAETVGAGPFQKTAPAVRLVLIPAAKSGQSQRTCYTPTRKENRLPPAVFPPPATPPRVSPPFLVPSSSSPSLHSSSCSIHKYPPACSTLHTTTQSFRSKVPISLINQSTSVDLMAAEAKTATTASSGAAEAEQGSKTVAVVVGVDDSEHSYHALDWAVRHIAAGMAGGAAELVIVHAKPSAASVIGFGAPGGFGGFGGAGEAMRCVEADLRKRAEAVVERARRVCITGSVHALIEVIEGEPRYVLCSAAEKHHADLLVVGSHGYGAIKRALLGSVSDYCAHHVHCSMMIVKQPKSKC